MKKAVVFPAGFGVPYVTDVDDDIDLRKVAKELGCEWIEIVRPRRLRNGFVMLIDEEGRLKDNSLNKIGCWFYETDKHGEPIVGNIMIVKEVPGPEGPELSGLEDAEANDVFYMVGRED